MNRINPRKALALLLAAAFSLSLFSCSRKTPSERFAAFLDALPAQIVSGSDYSVNFLFQNPEAYGIQQEPYEHPSVSREDYDSSRETIEDILAELHKIPLEKLSSQEQLTYRTVEDYFTRNLRLYSESGYYLTNPYLGGFLGYQAQLPALLMEFDFFRQADLDGYFHFLEATGDAFAQYAGFERERAEAGCGMCQDMLDSVMEQCGNLVAGGSDFLAESFNERIDQVDFLSPSEKEAAKEKNLSLLQDAFLPAYTQLSQDLEALSGGEEPLGLAHFEGGQAYYEAIVQADVGTDLTIAGVKARLTNGIQAALLALQAYMGENPDLDWELIGEEFCGFTSAEEAVDYLSQSTAADFPALPLLNYTVHPVPPAMEENTSPAYYITSPIDSSLDFHEAIYLNGDFTSEIFPTIAHEGYPGHMYQNVYYKSLQEPTIRYILNYPGYTEGWATYVEEMSYLYAPNSAGTNYLYCLNSHLSGLLYGLFDIGVHYDGWTVAELKEQCEYFYGELTDEEVREMYLLLLESPGNYLNYCLGGLLFDQMRGRAEEALGDRFVAADFHKVLLDAGPTSFPILSELVDQYIEAAGR